MIGEYLLVYIKTKHDETVRINYHDLDYALYQFEEYANADYHHVAVYDNVQALKIYDRHTKAMRDEISKMDLI